MPFLSNTFDSIGIDIGDRSIKAAYIKKHGKDFELLSFGSIEINPGIFDKGNILKPDQASSAIRQLVSSMGPKKIKTKYAHVCLPETQTFIKLLNIEAENEEEAKAKAREELPNHVPIDIQKSYVDSRIVEKIEASEEKMLCKILSGACPQKISNDYADLISISGLIPVSLQIEAEAIVNALMPKELQQNSVPTAIIDIGAGRSSFILFDNNAIQFSVSMPLSSNEITVDIARTMQFTYEQAEKSKRICGFDPSRCEKQIIDILFKSVATLAENIIKNNNFYLEHFSGAKPIAAIILCGGGAYLPGLPRELGARLKNMSVKLGNPLINIAKKRKKIIKKLKTEPNSFDSNNENLDSYNIPKEFSQKHEMSYATAIGLALSNVL